MEKEREISRVRAGKIVDWGRIRDSRRELEQDRKRRRRRKEGKKEQQS